MPMEAVDKSAKQLVLTVQEYSLFASRAFMNLFRRRFIGQSSSFNPILSVSVPPPSCCSPAFLRRRTCLAICRYALRVRGHRRYWALCCHVNDPRTWPRADRDHGFRAQRLLDGQRTGVDGRNRANRCHARTWRRSDAKAGHATHLRLNCDALFPDHRRRFLWHSGRCCRNRLHESPEWRPVPSHGLRIFAFPRHSAGLVKPLFFGYIVASIGCFYGMRTSGGTQGVGRSTIQAVVTSSVLIIFVDFLISQVMLSLFAR